MLELVARTGVRDLFHPVTCRIVGAVLLWLSPYSVVLADSAYPNKSIRLVAPTAAGGGSDIQARIVGAKLSDRWGHQVVVDNRSGAGSTIGTDIVAKAPPDGYTLLLAAAGHAINATLYRNLPYDTLNDFTGVVMLTSSPSVLVVNPAIAVVSVKELIEYVKARPGQLNYGSSGSGNSGHLAMELFKAMAGVNLVHIPYKGTAQAQTAILAGQELQMMFASPASVLQHVKAGRLKALGVTTSKRVPSIPDVPAIAEGLPGYEASFWYGIVAPAKTPQAIIAQINAEVNRLLVLTDVKEKLSALGVDPIGGTADEANRYMRAEVVKWRKVVRDSGASID